MKVVVYTHPEFVRRLPNSRNLRKNVICSIRAIRVIRVPLL